MPKFQTVPLNARFHSKVNVHGPIPQHRPELGPCHEWMAARNKDGYGSIGIGGRRTDLAHRVAFFLATGRWPKPCALHHCDNRACVKAVGDALGPAHIFEGTQSENVLDMERKGRARHLAGDLHAANVRPETRRRGELNGRAKLTRESVNRIREALARGISRRALASEHGVARSTIGRLVRGAWV